MFWRNKDVKRVNSCMTHCSKKSESQTPSAFPENRCSYCLEKNPGEWNYRWIKFRAEDLHHTYCRNLFSNKFANVLVKYFLSVRSMEHYFQRCSYVDVSCIMITYSISSNFCKKRFSGISLVLEFSIFLRIFFYWRFLVYFISREKRNKNGKP